MESPSNISTTLESLKASNSLFYAPSSEKSASFDELCCEICSEPSVDPVRDDAEHTFCRVCITTWLVDEGRGDCPSCRQNISLDTLKDSRKLRNLLDALLVKCPYWKPDDGECIFVGPRAALLEHLERDCKQHSERCAEQQRQKKLEREHARLEELFALLNPPQKDVIRLNVRGVAIDTTRRTLCLDKDSLIAKLFDPARDDLLNRDADGRVFLDRDPAAFREMLAKNFEEDESEGEDLTEKVAEMMAQMELEWKQKQELDRLRERK
jgi:hypothetical protein